MAWSRRRRVAAVAGGLWLVLCTIGEITAEDKRLPGGTGPAAALLSAPIPRLGLIARHTWLVVRAAGEDRWQRWDLFTEDGGGPLGHVATRFDGPEDDMGAGPSRVEWVIEGEEAAGLAACVRREAPRYADRVRYRAWPGPNSNTFVDAMLRTCEIARPMTGTAVGKDWRGWIGGSLTRERTGLQLETPLVGASAGLREGVEVHSFGLTVGVDLWPPALIVPFGEGRFGFE